MITMQLLENESIRNFIYDESPKKLLIGSRRVGKTSALLLNIFRNSTRPVPRDSVYITNYSGILTILKDQLLEICNDFNYQDVEVTELIRNSYIRIRIGQSNIYLTTRKGFSEVCRHIRFKDAYIDEPNSLLDLDGLLDEIETRTIWSSNDSKVIIAGSSYRNGEILRDLSANINYSRHVAIIDNSSIEELRQIMSTETFRTEVLCEFI